MKRAINFLIRKIHSGRSITHKKAILHFTYHKCLTVYYGRVIGHLCSEFKYPKEHFEKVEDFLFRALQAQQTTIGGLFSIHLYKRSKGDSDLDVWPQNKEIGNLEDYAVSHFIRHPKDLIVSGYKYHLWSNEHFFINPAFSWDRYTSHQMFKTYVEPNHGQPQNESYKSFLNRIDKFSGMVVECIFRETTFPIMENWDYNNPNVLTLRYEDIVGNEIDAFKKLCEHYQIKTPYKKRMLELAEFYSLKNQKAKPKSHIRDGRSNQWETDFNDDLHSIFDQMFPTLLKKTGYK